MSARPMLLVSSILAAVLFAIGYLVGAILPGGGEVEEADFTDFYEVDESFTTAFLLVFAMVAGSWALVWFFSELRARLADRILSRTAFGAALIGAASLAIGAVIAFAPAAVQMNSDAGFVGVPVAHAFAQAGLGLMVVVGMYSLALAVALFSLGLRQAGVIPGWLSIVGLVIAVLLLGSYIWLPGFLLSIWIVLVGVVGREQGATVR